MGNKQYVATYKDELALTRHFVNVLEQKLAGRDALRRTNVHPLDWCHLGVLGPEKIGRVPVELDAAQVEAELSGESVLTSNGSIGNDSQMVISPAATSAPVVVSLKSEGHELNEIPDEPRVVADKGDDREPH